MLKELSVNDSVIVSGGRNGLIELDSMELLHLAFELGCIILFAAYEIHKHPIMLKRFKQNAIDVPSKTKRD